MSARLAGLRRHGSGLVRAPRAASAAPAIEVDFPDLDRWAAGNTGTPYVWSFGSGKAGPHVCLQALTHGNEVCGAIALDWLLATGVRPHHGTLSICFANIDAYRGFDHADPYASRCIDEDFNRLWTDEVLRRSRAARPTSTARANCARSTTASIICSTCTR